ncbi:hypothetical protein B7486_11955 [cyanobacterium TDX16]|nr:hypothetical protein B7486_11955 [cyanobacterium TDX16]
MVDFGQDNSGRRVESCFDADDGILLPSGSGPGQSCAPGPSGISAHPAPAALNRPFAPHILQLHFQ